MLFLVKQEPVDRQKALLHRHNIITLYRQMCTYMSFDAPHTILNVRL